MKKDMTRIETTTPYSHITIRVNGHDVAITTDQEVTPAYMKEIVAHVKRIEANPSLKARTI